MIRFRIRHSGAIHSFWAAALGSVLAITALIFMLAWRPKAAPDGKILLLYCAAGVKPPVDEIIKKYKAEYGVEIQLQSGSSGDLLAKIEIAGKGDLFLPAEESYAKMAREKGVVAESIPVARMHLVLGVKKGNPKNIHSIQDLLKAGVRFGLPNTQAAAGRMAQTFLEKASKWDQVAANARTFKPVVTEVAGDVKMDALDAGIVWDATAIQFGLDAITVQEFEGAVSNVTINVLKDSRFPTAALRFARYMSACDKGLLEFKKFHYEPVEGDNWEETPKISLFAGGLNRVAVKDTIEEFKQREGVEVDSVFAGCGSLVGMMKTGRVPDIYFACDGSFFMPEVSEFFKSSQVISETDIVIIVPKGNLHGIHSLTDLGQSGLKVGIGGDLGTLGPLTRRLFKSVNATESILPNIRSEMPTADLLVAQVLTGGLDASIVYAANASTSKDQLDIIRIDNPLAIARQPIAITKSGRHAALCSRLIEAIKSLRSRNRFEKLDFRWRAPSEKP